MKINYKEVSVITRCPFCGRGNEVEVNEIDYLIGTMEGTRRTHFRIYPPKNVRCLLVESAPLVGKRRLAVIMMSKEVNKKKGEELQQFLAFRKRAYSVPQKKGKGSYKRSDFKKGE